jgi:hypothetical protein
MRGFIPFLVGPLECRTEWLNTACSSVLAPLVVVTLLACNCSVTEQALFDEIEHGVFLFILDVPHPFDFLA